MSLCFGDATGPVYPAPGGTTLTVTGSEDPGLGDGVTYSFSGFDPTAYGSLWWGPTNTSDSGAEGYPAGEIGPAGLMNFAGLQTISDWGSITSAYEWDDTALWSFPSSGDSTNLATRFLLSFAATTTKGAAGIASDNPSEPVEQVSGDFSASFVFQVYDPSTDTWEGVDTYYNSLPGTSASYSVSTSADFGFWSTSATPEPRLYGFVLAGMIGLALFFRRRSRSIPL